MTKEPQYFGVNILLVTEEPQYFGVNILFVLIAAMNKTCTDDILNEPSSKRGKNYALSPVLIVTVLAPVPPAEIKLILDIFLIKMNCVLTEPTLPGCIPDLGEVSPRCS